MMNRGALVAIALSSLAGAQTIPLALTTETLPTGAVGAPYAVAFTAAGGAPPYTFDVFSGTIGGVTMSPAGMFSGLPTTPATIPITFRVTDLFGMTAQKDLIVSIASGKPTQTVTYFAPNRVRLDYVAIAGQLDFLTTGQARSNYVEVFRSGLLLRSPRDYTQASAFPLLRVTLATPAAAGELVTVFYYPN